MIPCASYFRQGHFRLGLFALFFCIIRFSLASPEIDPALGPVIASKAAALKPKLVETRRDLHRHPELGNREVRTARFVADYLKGLGIEVKTGVGKTGVVGLLRAGANRGRRSLYGPIWMPCRYRN